MMTWINVIDESPEETPEIGTLVLMKLPPKEGRPRMYGDVMTGVYYKGKFHMDFHKGFIMHPTQWMPMPKT